jgi:hypothetical protein
MACCGGKRAEARLTGTGSGRTQGTAIHMPEVRTITFEYVGRKSLMVQGHVTGFRYQFHAPGARVAVDRRDASSVAGVPNLRRIAGEGK